MLEVEFYHVGEVFVDLDFGLVDSELVVHLEQPGFEVPEILEVFLDQYLVGDHSAG